MAFDSLILWFPPKVGTTKFFSFNFIVYCALRWIIVHFLGLSSLSRSIYITNRLVVALLIRRFQDPIVVHEFFSSARNKDNKNGSKSYHSVKLQQSNSCLFNWRLRLSRVYWKLNKTQDKREQKLSGTKAKSSAKMWNVFFQHGDKGDSSFSSSSIGIL